MTTGLLALAGYVALTCAIFAPLVADLSSGVLRGPTDGAQVIRSVWLFDQLGESPFTADRDPFVGAPEGVPLSPALNYAQPLQPGAVWLLSRALGDAAAFNVFVLAGFVLTAFAAYLLLRWLKLHPGAAFFGGALVAFNPWMIERALEGHAAFVHAWPLMLLLGALVAQHETRTPSMAALSGVAVGLSFLTAAYMGLLATLIAVTFLVTTFVLTHSRTERLWVFSLACVMLGTAALFLLPAGVSYLWDGDSVRTIASHSANELGSASVRQTLSFYVRPSAQHPVLGSLGIEPRLGTGNSEGVLYFGFTTIALAAIAGLMLFRRRSPIQSARARFALIGAVVLVPVAFVFSLPPRVELGGVELPLPSALLAELTTFYRVYARFGLVAGIAVALLAAAAVHLLLRRPGIPYLAFAAIALVAFELFPGRVPVWSPSDREHDRWLSDQPAGIVANYPMPTDQDPALELALQEQFRQRSHGQPLFTLLGPGLAGPARRQSVS